MYSDKKTVNMLTALLVDKGIRKAVVCPGSRNIPLVQNFSECPYIECFPVTDERSAAFYALGLSLAADEPVAVCVTSGSAVLNTATAVAEAYYRHVPLIVISADRPIEMIDRQDGQTLRQNGILKNVVKQQTDIPDFDSDNASGLNFASLSLNITLNECISGEPGPVHINMQLREPLFNFTEDALPEAESIVKAWRMEGDINETCRMITEKFLNARNRLIVIGQTMGNDKEMDRVVKALSKRFLVLCEPLATSAAQPFDNAMDRIGEILKREKIDMLLSLGGSFVSKRIKSALRSTEIRDHWEINRSGTPHDMFMQQTGVAVCGEKAFLSALLESSRERHTETDRIKTLVEPCLSKLEECIEDYSAPYSQLMAVKELEASLDDMDYDIEMHYANSMAVRLGCLLSSYRYIWCNRGVNGIDGSISTAAGFSLASEAMVFCVTGDLSFFYDQNALWNGQLRGNLRIMLLNNGGGNIFYRLKGLDNTIKGMDYIAGTHHVNARGICEQNDIGYLSAHNESEFRTALVHFLTEETKRPIVFEVFTDAEEDRKVLDRLEDTIDKSI